MFLDVIRRPVYISKHNVSEPGDGNRIQSPKHCVLICKQEGVLDKNRTMDNVQSVLMYRRHKLLDLIYIL
jgi:hypothetical protein